MAFQMTLADEVDIAIMPYQEEKSTHFNNGELAVMALAHGPKSKQEIVKWICTHFLEWEQIAIAYFSSSITNVYNTQQQRMDTLKLELELMYQHHGVPVYLRPDKSTYYTIDCEARIFLGDLLHVGPWTPEVPETLFPFFELPPELRNTIYDMVFYVSAHGVVLNCNQGFNRQKSRLEYERYDRIEELCRGMIRVAPDWLQKPTTLQFWDTMVAHNQVRYAGHVKDLLAATIVNRQWHEESIHSFCKVNTFICLDVEHLARFLKKLPVFHRPNIQNLSIVLTSTAGKRGNPCMQKNRRDTASTFTLMAQLPKLQTLNIDARSCEWVARNLSQFDASGAVQRPGLKQLLNVRVNGSITMHDMDPAMRLLFAKCVTPRAVPVKKKRVARKPRQAGAGGVSAAVLQMPAGQNLLLAPAQKPQGEVEHH